MSEIVKYVWSTLLPLGDVYQVFDKMHKPIVSFTPLYLGNRLGPAKTSGVNYSTKASFVGSYDRKIIAIGKS